MEHSKLQTLIRRNPSADRDQWLQLQLPIATGRKGKAGVGDKFIIFSALRWRIKCDKRVRFQGCLAMAK